MKKGIIISIVILVVLGLVGLSVYLDMNKNSAIKKIKSRPAEHMPYNVDKVLAQLETGAEGDIIFNEINGACEYVDGRYDCADFKLQSLLRILYKYPDKVPQAQKDLAKQTLLSFKYWMDQPGEDSMCYWSENHQILFATSEYLAGQLFPDDIFTNDGKTGQEHMMIAKERILIWLEQRWKYGFSEWYSNVYYVEDIAPISNLIDFANNEEIQTKAKIVMDLLLYDVATHSYKGTFVATSGRAYERNKKSGIQGNSMKAVIEKVWNYPVNPNNRIGMDMNFIFIEKYKVPDVITEIGKDEGVNVIKATTGLNVSELKERQLIGPENNQIMMQWTMEAFTNPQIVANSINYIDKNNMLSNEFLNDFKMINLTVLKKLHLLSLVSKGLKPVTNGTAIERANTYTYKTNDYMLSTAQNYHPGQYGDQQHIWSATLSDELSLFTTHPAKALSDKGALSESPGYWVGNGRNPHSVQDENINMSIYKIPDKKGFMEKSIVPYTHAYFPKEIFDEVVLNGNYAFGRYKDKYVAFIGKNTLQYLEDSKEDLIQEGKDVFWVFEIGTKQTEGSFEEFMNRIKSNTVTFVDDELIYLSNGKEMYLKYQGDFKINNEKVNTDYKRFDAAYSSTNREPDTITIEYNGKKVFLDFNNMVRTVN